MPDDFDFTEMMNYFQDGEETKEADNMCEEEEEVKESHFDVIEESKEPPRKSETLQVPTGIDVKITS